MKSDCCRLQRGGSSDIMVALSTIEELGEESCICKSRKRFAGMELGGGTAGTADRQDAPERGLAVCAGVIFCKPSRGGGYHHGGIVGLLRHCGGGLDHTAKVLGLAVFISLNVAVSAIVARRKGAGDRESANRVVRMLLLFTPDSHCIDQRCFCHLCRTHCVTGGVSARYPHEYAVEYLRIIMGGSVFPTVSLVLNRGTAGAGNTRIAMVTNVIPIW